MQAQTASSAEKAAGRGAPEQPAPRRVRLTRSRVLKALRGTGENPGLLKKLVIYFLLICIGFVYLYPLLYMLATSVMSTDDLISGSVKWISSSFNGSNFTAAFQTLHYGSSFLYTLLISLLPSLIQATVCSLIGYGLARYQFRGKKLVMFIMLLSFVIPPQILMMPTYSLYVDLKLVGSLWAFLLPALLGQGFKSAIFILIYYQFYKQIPASLMEAAQIDGAGHGTCYFRIAVPSVVPAVVVVFLFSVVFYWNETYLVNLYLGNTASGAQTNLTTLLLELQRFQANFEAMVSLSASGGAQRLNEAIEMAGLLLTILPLLALFGFLQKFFVQSIDQAGITGQ